MRLSTVCLAPSLGPHRYICQHVRNARFARPSDSFVLLEPLRCQPQGLMTPDTQLAIRLKPLLAKFGSFEVGTC